MKSLLLGLIFPLSVFGAIKRDFSADVSRSRTEVVDFGARLATLEKEIGSKNDLYISGLTQIKQFESDIKLYKDRLEQIQKQVHEARIDNQKIIKNYLVSSEDDAGEVWQKKVHLELLKQADQKLKARESELASFEAKVAEFDTKLLDLKRNEEDLAKLIKDLEEKKKVTMEKYMARVQDKKKVETQYIREKVEARANKIRQEFSHAPVIVKRPDRIFSRPVEDFQSYVSSQKGVTFKFDSVQPIKAPDSGKVVFAGDLSTFGQVVLIDHGDDLRTVLLGRMDIKVKKNDMVSSGEILAYTSNELKGAQNLYFEVRKKNTAQNTILWLDLDGVGKI